MKAGWCLPCACVYMWRSARNLVDAACPHCGTGLLAPPDSTTHLSVSIVDDVPRLPPSARKGRSGSTKLQSPIKHRPGPTSPRSVGGATPRPTR